VTPTPDEPFGLRFSDEEFERRHRLLRNAMDEHGLDCLLLAGSPGYMSGGHGAFWASGYPERLGVVSYVVFPRDGEPTLVIPFAGSHVETARRASFVSDVRDSAHGDYTSVIADRLMELDISTGDVGVTELDARYGLGVPHELLSGLRERLPGVEIRATRGLLEPLMAVKSPEEIAAIEQASVICDEVLDELAARVEPGLRDYEVRAMIGGAIMARRGDLAFAIVGSTPMADPSFAFPFAIESARTIRPGDVVINEFGARYKGYEGQTGRPLTIGPPTPEFRDLWTIATQGAFALEEALRPGATAEDIRIAGKRVFDDAGRVIAAPMLHTLGICNSTPVVFLDFVVGDPGFEFQEGMVVSLQSNPASPDRRTGLFMGNDYVVTSSGCRRLSTLPFDVIEIV